MPAKGTSSTTNTEKQKASGDRSRSAAAKKREAEKRAALRKKQQRILRIKEISLILIGGICILLFLSCFVGALSWLKNISYYLFGIMMYVMPFALLALTVLLLYSAINFRLVRKLIALFICLFAVQGILAVMLKPADGGLLGRANYALFFNALGSIGSYVVNVIILAIGVVLFTDYSLIDLAFKHDQEEEQLSEEEASRLKMKEEQRELKRQNAEMRRTMKKQAEIDRLRNKNRELNRQVEENQKRLNASDERFKPIIGIGDTRITDDRPAGDDEFRPEEEETKVYVPEDKKKAAAEKKETRKEETAGRYTNSGSLPPSDDELKCIEGSDFPAIYVPSSYFDTEEEDDFVGVFKDHSKDEIVKDTKEETADAVSEKVPVQGSAGAETAVPAGTSAASVHEKLKSDPEEDKKTASEIENAMVKQPEKEYTFPPLRLLSRGSNASLSRSELKNELQENAAKLQNTLKTFGVDVTITDISCGPAVTRYEIQPASGVKVSRIVSLTDDIKLNLAAADIRMEAPIPGKSAIGIEIPNKVKQSVMLRDLLETDDFKNAKSKLAFGAGRDIEGKTIIADIVKMPHVLVAGTTGSGKSVCINSIIMSVLYHAKPTEVKMIMIDPKVVELSVYNGIPHLLLPVVTDPKKAASALNWAVAEMEKRYQLFAEFGVRNAEGFNSMIDMEAPEGENGEPMQKMPQILIIVDELADLMMVAANDVENSICRLAQKARAAGLHLVLATQRPSVDVITGLIKANIPSRIAFAVNSGTDSRTILDMNGAEKLLGMGDMLYAPAGASKPLRVQGSYVSDEDVKKVVDFITEQGPVKGGLADPNINLEQTSQGQGASGSSERDEYFADAGRLVIEKEKASIGMLQRAFKLGFNRAARIVDQLCDAGVVGEEEGTKPRKILMKADEFEAYLQSLKE